MGEGGESQPSRDAVGLGALIHGLRCRDCPACRRWSLCGASHVACGRFLLLLIRPLVEDGAPCSQEVRPKTSFGPRVLFVRAPVFVVQRSGTARSFVDTELVGPPVLPSSPLGGWGSMLAQGAAEDFLLTPGPLRPGASLRCPKSWQQACVRGRGRATKPRQWSPGPPVALICGVSLSADNFDTAGQHDAPVRPPP